MDFSPTDSISLSHQDILTNIGHGSQGAVENGGLSELLSQQNIEGDENSEWLSVFVEDCLSSPRNYGLSPASHPMVTITSHQNPPKTLLQNPYPVTKAENSDNPTRKRKKKLKLKSIMKLKTHKTASIFGLDYYSFSTELEFDPDPPLLQQAHWLADSELVFPINHNSPGKELSCTEEPKCYIEPKSNHEKKKVLKPRRCTHCQAEKTPLWRQGPLGKGTLCNACGVRWLKTGNLFPEYRPANSPTFVSDLHSNILRKVLKMREAQQSSSGGEQ